MQQKNKTMKKTLILLLVTITNFCFAGIPVDSVNAWKKQANYLKTDLNTYETIRIYAKAKSLTIIPLDSVNAWKNQAAKDKIDLNTYITGLILLTPGGAAPGTVTGTLTANFLPVSTGSNSIANSVLSQVSNTLNIGTSFINTTATYQIGVSTLPGRNKLGVLMTNDWNSYSDQPISNFNGTKFTHYSPVQSPYYLANASNGFLINNSTDAANLFKVTDAGNVGIGTVSPLAKMQINSSDNDGILLINTTSSANNLKMETSNTYGGSFRIYDNLGNLKISFTGNDFGSYINTNNSFGIGTNTPKSTTKLHIKTAVNRNILFYDYSNLATIQAENDLGSAFVPIQFYASQYIYNNILEYADNTAAISGGLTVGAFYRTGDVLKIVH